MIDKIIFRVYSYLCYWWQSRGDHYLHSPFVFEWYEAMQEVDEDLEMKASAYRKLLAKNDRLVWIGAKQISVGARYELTSISTYYGEILSKTAAMIPQKRFLELGTSLGVSTAYLAMADENSSGHSIDMNAELIEIAMDCFEKLNLNQRVRFHTGSFDSILGSVLEEMQSVDVCYLDGDHSYAATMNNVSKILPFLSAHSVLILDDIRWSRDMFASWSELCKNSAFNYSIDFGRIGLLFQVPNHSPKQHFVLR